MTPNLRYNKRMTAKLIKAAPKEREKVSLLSAEWNIENRKHVYGLIHWGLLRNDVFYFQKYDEGLYRLIYMEDNYECHCYIIDDIEQFMDFIGISIINLDDKEEPSGDLLDALDSLKELPHTGIIVINEGRIFVYEHHNY